MVKVLRSLCGAREGVNALGLVAAVGSGAAEFFVCGEAKG